MATVQTVRGPIDLDSMGTTLTPGDGLLRQEQRRPHQGGHRPRRGLQRLDYPKSIMDRGASSIGCDRFGLDMFNPTPERVETIATLCSQGYADRIVLGHDAACYMDFFSGETAQQMLAEAAPNWHYQHISADVLPALREQGVTDDQIRTMMVDNPRRYFATEAA